MSFISSTLSTVLAAGITAVLGFLFRNSIRKAFLGNRLYPKEMIPRLSVEGEARTCYGGREFYLVAMENTGPIPIADIRFFITRVGLKGDSLVVNYIDAPISYEGNWANDGCGERMQIEIPSSKLPAYGDGDYRLYVQFSAADGTVYRNTYYLFKNRSLQKISNHARHKAPAQTHNQGKPSRNGIFSAAQILARSFLWLKDASLKRHRDYGCRRNCEGLPAAVGMVAAGFGCWRRPPFGLMVFGERFLGHSFCYHTFVRLSAKEG